MCRRARACTVPAERLGSELEGCAGFIPHDPGSLEKPGAEKQPRILWEPRAICR